MAADQHNAMRLSWGQLAVFSLPVLMIQAIEIPWRVYLPAVLTQNLGYGLAVIGTLLFAIRLFDTFFDLAVGWASDRWPTRFGRRKPWMAAGLPLILLGGWQVFVATDGRSLAWLTFGCVLLHAGYTMVATPHGGWGLEIGRTSRERLRVLAVKSWLGALAMPLVITLPSVLERVVAADRALQLRAMGALLLVIAPAIVLLVLHVVPERPVTIAPFARQRPSLLRAIGIVRRPAFLRIAALYAIAGLVEATSSGAFLFFVEGSLGLRGWASTLLLAQAAIAVVAMPLWAAFGARIGKSRALMIAFAVQATTMALIIALPTGAIAACLALLAIRYACWGTDFLFLRAQVADMADRDSVEGSSSAATYYAAFNVTLRTTMSLGAGLVLWIPAALHVAPRDGTTFDAVVRLVFTVPSCLGALLGLLLLGSGLRRGPKAHLSGATSLAS